MHHMMNEFCNKTFALFQIPNHLGGVNTISHMLCSIQKE